MKKTIYINSLLRYTLIASLLLCSACSSTRTAQYPHETTVRTVTIKDPGAVEYVWEPPIIDVVEVPPGLDPEGHYYRPQHEEVVEIRQGRWKYKRSKDIEKTK